MNEKFQKLGFYPADILLPKDADMTKWAVVDVYKRQVWTLSCAFTSRI